MDNLEAKYIRAISRAAAIMETAKHGLKHADTYVVNDHVRLLDSIRKDAQEIAKATS